MTNTLTCKDCPYCYMEDEDDFPCCHFHPMDDLDPAPCEVDDYVEEDDNFDADEAMYDDV